ncbi:hypothetical protein SmJEL517_g04667 [Synchytrium microbalum]|uniref:Uncharacterized protein n=1 Tax=Synchytrium microbalum TaxID=1806994 RepID=A0A507BQT1_9FUNG|nr:uncharacterized protein SmJEL517_g04667 [Synchytrium microbalum]TPX32120.1 hypothetical protein SmJEL517_g04667 [Synchytrium microbalum]
MGEYPTPIAQITDKVKLWDVSVIPDRRLEDTPKPEEWPAIVESFRKDLDTHIRALCSDIPLGYVLGQPKLLRYDADSFDQRLHEDGPHLERVFVILHLDRAKGTAFPKYPLTSPKSYDLNDYRAVIVEAGQAALFWEGLTRFGSANERIGRAALKPRISFLQPSYQQLLLRYEENVMWMPNVDRYTRVLHRFVTIQYHRLTNLCNEKAPSESILLMTSINQETQTINDCKKSGDWSHWQQGIQAEWKSLSDRKALVNC